MIVMILSFLRRAPCSRRSFTFVAIALQSVVSRLSHRYHILLLWKGTTSIYPVVVNVLMFNMPVNGLAINALNGCQDAMVCDALLHQTVLGLRLPCGFFCDATDCPREGSIEAINRSANYNVCMGNKFTLPIFFSIDYAIWQLLRRNKTHLLTIATDPF